MKLDDIGGQLVKGHLEMLLLGVLEQGPLHGYAIIEQLRKRSGGVFELPEGTIYPALHRLEDAGCLTSSWSEAAGRRRREYRLTGEGREALAAKREQWTSFSAAVGGVIGTALAGGAL
ncbi:helix-turn-helix transcriptional regulator [bacterium]|nr:helix-turn-helix transcriptional regulator [bacterium]